MIERIRRWLISDLRRAYKKRHLERIAMECGASRSVARRIVALYFSHKEGAR